MPEVSGFNHGEFCWGEISTTDVAAGRDFYKGVFGWDHEDSDIPGGGVYTTFKIGGKGVGAISAQMEHEKEHGIPAHWNLYVRVDDADIIAKKAEAAGGTVHAQPFDVMEYGRMAVIADPAGGVVGVWQSRMHTGFQMIKEPGAMDWNELMSTDIAKAKAFYTEVFGWETEEADMGEAASSASYTLFKMGEDNIAGGMQAPEGMEGIPSHWTIYYRVSDADATVAKIKELGGQIYFGPETMAGVGRFASCADPQGATFGIIQSEPE
ncbi:MAG TPA: VOC family protein [Actinomycetota bacterium]|nr:VOC family protein [Actinomycetota bacterium]